MQIGPRTYRLEARDEFPHTIENVANFNESVYINLFDHQQRMGGWFRVGNRPNEGHAEMSTCIYLPDGRVGFMFRRAPKDTNDDYDAAGLSISIVEPLHKIRVQFDGKLCLLDDPAEMADPPRAFAENPHVPCRVDLAYRNVAPIFGGLPVDERGNPIDESPEEAFARAHYEQHLAGAGTIAVGDDVWHVSGLGLRDHSWGPRFWQNIYWYRWLPMSFTEDFALMISIITRASGQQRIGGMILEHGAYEPVLNAELQVDYDERGYQRTLTAVAHTAKQSYRIDGRVLSLIPLRNRRQSTDGRELMTRITEGFTEYRCNGLVGYGMSEFLDQIVDGRPVGP
jgi:hypothetical protein